MGASSIVSIYIFLDAISQQYIYIYISGVCVFMSLMISETTGSIILKFGMWVPLAPT